MRKIWILFRRTGTSPAIAVPKEICKVLGAKVGDPMTWIVIDGKVQLRKISIPAS